MWKKILEMLDLDNSEKHAEMYLISEEGTLFDTHEALQWVKDNITGAIPNIAHGGGGPALRILLIYRKRREINAAVKAIKAKYNAPLHFIVK